MDCSQLAQELVRALRADRSQRAVARVLGYRSNVVYLWESGRRFPQTSDLHRLAARRGVVLADVYQQFLRTSIPDDGRPLWLRVLSVLRARQTIRRWAEAAGVSRFTLGRWLAGRGEPRLPDYLALVDAATHRLPELASELADRRHLPSIAARLAHLDARRRLAIELPWSQAILRAVELVDYQRQPRHEVGWIAALVGIDEATEVECVGAMAEAGLLRWDGVRYQTTPTTVDLGRRSDEARMKLKLHWAQVALERLTARSPNLFSYNLFSISRADLAKLRAMHVQHFEATRNLIAASEPAETIGLTFSVTLDLSPTSGDDGRQ